MTFTVDSTDYSANIIAGTYKVNNKPLYKIWKDANEQIHKIKLRDKVVGSFDMFFRSVSDYETFKGHLDEAKDTDNSIAISVTVNNTSTQANINAFIDYEPVRDIDGTWNDYFEKFTVTIEER